MALASESYAYSRSSSFSVARSPDTASPIYPERAIRPLPKSRLKSKLSPEQASTIKYPPNPPPISPTLHFSPPVDGAHTAAHNSDTNEGHYHRHEPALVHEHCSCQHGDGDSGDEEVEFDHPDYRYATSPLAGEKSRHVHDSVQRRLIDAAKTSHDGRKAGAVESTASSADGYESFENTSNKKKRKIPLSTMSATHQSRLSAELANMGIRADDEIDEAPDSARLAHGLPYDHAVAGTGISGAGRGRFGRREAKDGRRPLANTTVNVPNGYSARVPARGGDAKDYDPASPQTPGIITRALRTAAEAGPLPSQKGKENVSLLQQNAHAAGASPKTQFTFTCESDSGKQLLEQQPALRDSYRDRSVPTYANTGYNGQRAPAADQRQGQVNQNMHPPRAPASQMPPPARPQSAQPQQKPPRPRRTPSKEYALAARQRKIQQQFSNYHHRPRPEDMWICQFCEYEDIFGVPPLALIRAYEIKDRQERKKAAEKRRLLEKAKQRGRKGKKGSKAAGKNASAAPAPAQDQRYDQRGASLDGDDYYDDEDDGYGDEYDPLAPDGDEGDYDTGDYYEHPPPQPLISHGRGGG